MIFARESTQFAQIKLQAVIVIKVFAGVKKPGIAGLLLLPKLEVKIDEPSFLYC